MSARRLWTGSQDDQPGTPGWPRPVQRVRAEPLDVVSIRLRFAIAIALAALGMVIVLAGLAALS